MEQTLILVDESDNFIGYAPRNECHRGDGKLHRAIAVILFNNQKQILLQKRKSQLWDGYWDITGATHPLHYPDHDESYEDAARRCLKAEWNVEVASLEPVIAFTYSERFDGFSENEYCVLLLGQYDGAISLNPEYAYDMRWTGFQECRQDARLNPSTYTPWARMAVDKLSEHPFSSRLVA